MKHITRALLLFGVLLLSGSVQAADGKVKVFILAGQSNMEGKGFPDPVAWQISQPKYRDRYKHFILPPQVLPHIPALVHNF